MLRATFNKPAVNAYFPGLGTTISAMEVLLDGGRIAFRGTSVAPSENKNVMTIDARERGGAALVFMKNVDLVYKALHNPNGNPFFLLERRNGWIIPVPYVEKHAARGRKSEPSRVEPHLRVWLEEAHRGVPQQPASQDRQSIFPADIINALQVVQDHHHEGAVASESVNKAIEVLKTFELLAKHVLPDFSASARSKLHDWSKPTTVKHIDMEKIFFDPVLRTSIQSPLDKFVTTLPKKGQSASV